MLSPPLAPSSLRRRSLLRSKTEKPTFSFVMTPFSPFPMHTQKYLHSVRRHKLCDSVGVRISPLRSAPNFLDSALRPHSPSHRKPALTGSAYSLQMKLSERALKLGEAVLLHPPPHPTIEEEETDIDQPLSPLSEGLKTMLSDFSQASKSAHRKKGKRRQPTIPKFSLPSSPTNKVLSKTPLIRHRKTRSDQPLQVPETVLPTRGKTRGVGGGTGKKGLMRPVLGENSRVTGVGRLGWTEGEAEEFDMETIGRYRLIPTAKFHLS